MRFEVPFPAGVPPAAVRGGGIALSPDGAYITYVGLGDRGWQLYLRPMDRLNAAPLPGTEGGTNPTFSPDGHWILFTVEGSLRKVQVGGGPPITVLDTLELRGADWSSEDCIFMGSTSGLWRVRAEGGTPEQLTTLNADRGDVFHSRPEVLSGGGVLFTIFTGVLEEAQVAVLSLASGEVTALFPGNTPRYSETGHLVYGRADGVLMAVPFDPDRLEVTGQAIPLAEGVLVSPGGATAFAVARNGSLVYLTGAGASGTIVMVDRRGGEQPLIEGPDVFYSPRFSPDGTRLAYTIGLPPRSQVWIREIAQGTSMPLTFEGDNFYPVWSPDGERVVFTHRRGVGDPDDLFWRRADGSGVAEPLLTADHSQRGSSFSPDGRHLVYRESHPVTRNDIWVLPLEGDQEPRAFTEPSPYDEITPMLSPDGRWLAYVSNLSGRHEVYVNSFPEPGGRRPVSVSGGTEPVWSRDGDELFYRSGRALMVAAVESAPDFRVLSREVLFEGPYTRMEWFSNYDIHPDGERFVMIRPAGEQSSRLVVVLNWFEELLQRSGSLTP